MRAPGASRRTAALAAWISLAWAHPALADELRDLCPDRPGLGTPACTIDAGHVAVELGIGDWMHDRQGAVRTDTVQLGDALVRVGLTDSLEAQLGWTAYGHVTTRDRTAGTRRRVSGIGDITVALRHNIHNPDGSGFSIAAMPFATLPTGNGAIGDGDWSTGLLIPMSFELSTREPFAERVRLLLAER